MKRYPAARSAALLLFLLAMRGGLYGEEAKRVAVLDFAANNTSQAIARIVRNRVEMALFGTGAFDMLEQDRIELVMKERRLQRTNCRERECAARLGKLLRARYVVIGSVDRLGTYVITVKVVDVQEKKVLIADSQEAEGENNLKEASEKLSGRISEKLLEFGRERPSGSIRFLFLGGCHYLSPRGYLGSIVSTGYGFSLKALAENLFAEDFRFGLDVRYGSFDGNGGAVHHALLFPLMLHAGYRFRFRSLSVVPSLSAGCSYNSLFLYSDENRTDYSKKSRFQPLAAGSLSLEMELWGAFVIHCAGEYGTIFEKEGRIAFLSVQAGAGIRF